MTKAKTKSRRVWLLLFGNGTIARIFLHRENAAVLQTDDIKIIPATLTYTPPANAKKRSAKR